MSDKMIVEMPNGRRIRGTPDICAQLAVESYGGGYYPTSYNSQYKDLPFPLNMPWPSMKGGGTTGGAM